MTGRIVDANVNLSRWPTRRLPLDETGKLAAKLRSLGVEEAWAGTFDGLLHKDLASANDRLARECREISAIRLVPFGTVNPLLPDWEEDLRRCAEDHRMPGIRVYPAYHGYGLDHPAFARLLGLAATRRLVVAIPLIMEDQRTMHPRLIVPPVDTTPLAGLLEKTPGARVLLLNALTLLKGEKLAALFRAGDVSVDIAMLEGVAGVANLLKAVPEDRVLFGTHAPFFYPESAAMKLRESPLADPQARAIREGNARRLLTWPEP
ncbi:amidohydrolase family protein [Tundrisphaera sp. TA3]|uniref:amidohydrolase family protein n=1 Tax=Tundrisphaera sp. TA3 TaxID=3435775 RepID=UPI003EB9BDE2